MRPGIVHRIDMNTTGVLVVCKNDFAHNSLAEQLKGAFRSPRVYYYAIVFGNLREDEGTVHAPIGRHPTDRKKMSIHSNRGAMRSRITAYWNASGRIHLSSAAWRRDAHTRSASIWQASVIRFWAMRCVRCGAAAIFTGRADPACGSLRLYPSADPESMWSFLRRCQRILKNCWRSCGKSWKVKAT